MEPYLAYCHAGVFVQVGPGGVDYFEVGRFVSCLFDFCLRKMGRKGGVGEGGYLRMIDEKEEMR